MAGEAGRKNNPSIAPTTNFIYLQMYFLMWFFLDVVVDLSIALITNSYMTANESFSDNLTLKR